MKANIKGLIKLLNPDLNEIVFGKQISESPSNPYASFRFISGPRLGRPFKSTTYDAINKPNVVTEHLQTQRLLNVEIVYYTKTASDLLEDVEKGLTVVNKEARIFVDDFVNGLEGSLVLDYMTDNKFSILNFNDDFREIDDFLSDVWERRATIEIQTNFVGYSASDIPFISGENPAGTSASITGNFVNPDGSDL